MDIKTVKYPIYIVSKGRYENPITAKHFLKDGIDFKIVIEPHELDGYRKTIPEKNIAVLPFSNLGLGSYPARNWCWDDSLKNGYSKHFLFDDNIYGFARLNEGLRKKCHSLEALITLQDFTERFSNVGISGYNYSMFVGRFITKPFFINTHVYSGMLINNKIPFRWRLKYNEDVDLCLQVLHAKWCTINLNAFVINKVSTTAKLKGGNQTELYKNNDPGKKYLKASVLKEVWPQYAEIKYRFGRPHHYVDWKKHFKHPLIKVKQ